MTVAIAEVGRQGRFDIAFAPRHGRTIIRHSYCEVPFKITRLLDTGAGDVAHLILMQCSAGLFPGDDLECTIRVDSGARAVIRQQSATKVHPPGSSQKGTAARQNTRIYVESGAELVLALEPVIPFAGSRLQQKTRIEIEPGGRLVYWEGLMAGRIGKDESWEFAELSSEIQLIAAGRLCYLERYALDSARPDLSSAWIMRKAGYVGTGLCFSQEAGDLIERLHEALPEAGVDLLGPNLAAVRVIAQSGPDFHRSRKTFQELSVTHL
jgi:urease accessory protein